MRPTFGCNAFSYVFESNTPDFRADVEREIRQSITKWEPRVRIESVIVSPENEVTEPGQILVTVVYTIVTTGEVDSTTVAGGL